MLKTQYPTDYLKKEVIDSEVPETIEEEQYIEQQTLTTLRRFKRALYGQQDNYLYDEKTKLRENLIITLREGELEQAIELITSLESEDLDLFLTGLYTLEDDFNEINNRITEIIPKLSNDHIIAILIHRIKQYCTDETSYNLTQINYAVGKLLSLEIEKLRIIVTESLEKTLPEIEKIENKAFLLNELDQVLKRTGYIIKKSQTSSGVKLILSSSAQNLQIPEQHSVQHSSHDSISRQANPPELEQQPSENRVERADNEPQPEPSRQVNNQAENPQSSLVQQSSSDHRQSAGFSDYDDNQDQTKLNEDLMNTVRGNDSETEKLKKIEDLLNEGADINFKDANHQYNTPLHAAVRKGNLEVVRLLIRKGANIVGNGNKNTPLDIAKRPNIPNGQEIVNILEEHLSLSQHSVQVNPAQSSLIQQSSVIAAQENSNTENQRPEQQRRIPYSGKLPSDKDLQLSNSNFKSIIDDDIKNIEGLNVANFLNRPAYPDEYLLVRFASRVYEEKEDGQELSDQTLPEDWKLLTTAYNQDAKNHYFGAAYWNPNYRQIVIAHRGTDPTSTGALWTDLKGILWNQYAPQMSSASTFANEIVVALSEFNEKHNVNLQLSFTGHSLGGWLAQVTTFTTKYFALKSFKNAGSFFVKKDGQVGYHAHTVVFDSPGSKDMLSKMKDDFDLRYNKDHDSLSPSSLDITSYLSAPNLVNTCCSHLGSIYRVFIDGLPLQRSGLDFAKYTTETHAIAKIKEALNPEQGKELKKVKDWPLVKKGITKRAIEKLLLTPITVVVEAVHRIFFRQSESEPLPKSDEYEYFHILAEGVDNYNPEPDDKGGYCIIRYQVQDVDKTKCSTSVFTQPELEFLYDYQKLRQFLTPPQLQGLFSSFNNENAEKKAIEVLETFEVGNPKKTIGCKSEIELNNLITYIKNALYFFPDVKDKTKNMQIRKTIWFDVKDPVISFTGRQKQLNQLSTAIEQVVVISGLSGVGKSALAIKYASSKYSQDSAIWINANTLEDAEKSFRVLAKDKLEINLEDIGGGKKTIKSIVQDVYEYFADKESLFIFDNAQKYTDIENFLPLNLPSSSNKPLVLITSNSQRSEWNIQRTEVKIVELNNFNEQEATEFIKKFLDIKDNSQNEDITKLAGKLDYLPIRLQKAVAYIEQEANKQGEFKVHGYLRDYAKAEGGLANSAVLQQVDDKITFTALKAALEKIEGDQEHGQKALEIASIMSYFASGSVQEEFFLKLVNNDRASLNAIIHLLTQYSIAVQGSIGMHELVQQVMRSKLQGNEEEEKTLEQALSLLKDHMKDFDSVESYVPHIISIWNYASKYNRLIEDFIVNDVINDTENRSIKYFHLIAGSRNGEVVNTILSKITDSNKLRKVINARDESKRTPLHYAAQGGNEEIVRLLISKGANVDTKDRIDNRPLHIAAKNGHLKVVEVLLDKNSDIIHTVTGPKYKFTPLHLAAWNGYADVVTTLISRGANINAETKYKYTPLHLAAEKGYIEVIQALLKEDNKVSINAETEYKLTPLHLAAEKGHVAVVKALLSKGAGINAQDTGKFTPLHLAAFNGRLDVVEFLIGRGADINAQTTKGNTQLHLAVESGNLEVVKVLIAKKPDMMDIENEEGDKAFDLAIKREDSEVGNYIKQQTFNRRAGTSGISGQLYEIQLLMLFLLKGPEKTNGFHLATNVKEAGDFDDVVFKYKDQGGTEKPQIIFLQAKHRDNVDKDKISTEKLFSESEKGDFNLKKYFNSYRKIKQQFSEEEVDTIFGGKFEDSDLIIFTNALSNFNENDKSIEKIAVDQDDILSVEENSYYYKLSLDEKVNKKRIDTLQYASYCKKLARELVNSIFSDKELDINEGILRDYHIPLADKVIEKKGGKLRDSFLSDEDSPFRNTFFEEVRKRDGFTEKSEDELKLELQGRNIKLPENFGRMNAKKGKYPESLPSDLVSEDEIKEFLSKLKLFVDQPNESKLSEIVKSKIKEAHRVAEQYIDSVFSDVEYRVRRWWHTGDKYLTENNRFFQDAARVSIKFDVKDPVHLFTGRGKELGELHSLLQGEGKVVISSLQKIASVTGLGGIGKSELTRKYISKHSKDYDDNVIWINADNYLTIAESFRRLAKDKLGISTTDINGKKKNIESIIPEVYDFFTKRQRKSLFVFDNAEKYKAVKEGDESEGIDRFLPSGPDKPSVLITSRDQEWGENIAKLQLDVFTEEEAVEFIKKALKVEDGSQESEIKSLAKELQYFPLALQQAVAYIRTENQKSSGKWGNEEFTISKYLELYKREAKKVFNEASGDSYTNTVLTTWQITIDKIKEKMGGEQASEVLDVIAYLAPNGIPIEEIFSQLISNKGERERAVELLDQYSMANLDHGTLDIHRLVQQVIRIKLKEQNRVEGTVEKTFGLLGKSFPYGSDRSEDHPRKQQLLPHFEAFLSNIDDWIKKDPAKKQTIEEAYVEDLLTGMGDGYRDLGDPKRKKELLERALVIQEKHYGTDHFQVAITLVNLGNAYLADPKKQKKLFERALPIFERHYGHDHFEVAKILQNLGVTYGVLGNLQKQKELLERALKIQKRYYSPGHFEVASTLGNLGIAYGHLGNHQKKKELLERALPIMERHYGRDHFQVAKLLANLGNAYGALGDPHKAKELLERALAIQEKHYGRDHFEVAMTLNNLGNAYGALGDPNKRKELLERALPIMERHYGRDHFEVAKLLANLGNVYGDLGDPQKQKELLERALSIFERHYGHDHFEVARMLTNLSNAYEALGNHQKQKELLERALPIFERRYGHDHFEVARMLTNLSNAYEALGNHQKQKELLERALPIFERRYGHDHFKVARMLTNLSNAYGALVDPLEAKKLLERALPIFEKHYGPDHFQIAITLTNLGNAYGALGDTLEAKKLLERALPIFERDNHPFVNTVREILSEFSIITPLHLASKSGNLGMVKNLIEKGADIFARSSHNTILHQAVSSNNEEVIRLILSKIKEKNPQKVSEHINAGDTEGDTPLMWAAATGKISAVQILLEYGADINAVNKNGITALNWAAKGNHWEVATILLSQDSIIVSSLSDQQREELTSYAIEHYQSDVVDKLVIKLFPDNQSQVQFYKIQQKAYLHLSKFTSHHFPHIALESVKQGLYLPAFEARNIKINGKCAAITRVFSQELSLEQQGETLNQDRKPHELFLSNLQTSAELYERLAQGKQVSQREEREIFALSGVLDGFEQELDSPTSSLPSTFSHIKSYKTLTDLSAYVTGLSGDFALHLVTSNHVVAIYRVGDNYAYFDTNVAFVSGIQTISDLMKVVEKGIEFAGYEVDSEGFLVEHFDVGKANQLLPIKQKETLTKPIQTERHLLSLQDQELGPININGHQVSRVTLYDIGTKVHVEGSTPILINADMNLRNENFIAYLNAGKISVTAREYLDNLRNGGEQIGQEGVKIMPFSGSSREIKDAEQARELVLSDDGSKLKSYELSKLLKSPVEQSMKALPYYLEVANAKHWPNRLTNAAGRVSLFHGGFGTFQSLRYGDDLGFALGAGEMSFSVLSQLIEDGVVKVTPQIIKQMKHGLLLSRGFGGMISNPFDMYDLIDSLIDLSHATKGSKEWRDSIAGSVFAGGSVLSSIGFTAINKPGAGTLIGLGIIMGQSIYSGASMVEEYKKYDLTFDEKFRLFWHTFAMQLPPEDVQYIEARKNIINEIARNVWESLEKSGAKAYATGLGEITFKDPVRDELPSNHRIRPYGQEMNAFPIPVGGDLSEIRIKPRTPVLHPSNATILMDLSSIKGTNYRDFLSRILPGSPSPHAKVFCLPASSGEAHERDHTFSNPHSVYRSSNDITSYCENAIAVENKQSSQEKMIHDLNLVKEGIVVGSNEYENQFIISENFDFSSKTSKPFLSRAEILGGENTKNVFSVTNRMFKGKIIGGKNSSNVVDISNIRNGYLVDVNGSQIDRREYVKNHYMFGSVNEQRDNLHVSGVDNFVLSANVTIKGGGGNYTFYIKPNVGHSRINVLAEKGYLVFPETNVLSSCNFTYNLEHNTLSLQMPRGFRLDAENYLIKQEGGNYVYRFELADKGGAFEPLINLNVNTNNAVNTNNSKSNTINSFYLRTKTNLFYNLVPEWYRNMTQGREVYGVVDLLNYPITGKQPQMIFGTSKSDIIPLDKAFYAEGGNGSDAYSITADKSAFTTEINNYAGDKVNDVIYIPTAEKVNVEKIRDNLYIYTATYGMEVKNYFRGEEYKHLTIVDKNKNVFIPLESQSGIKLVPFYHARDEQSIFSLERTNGEIVIDAKLDKVRIYRDNSDLLLVDDKPLIIKLEKFYDKHWNNLTLYFQDKERLNYQQLEQLSKLAINYHSGMKSVYYDNVKEYVVPDSNVTVHHNQKFVNGSLTTLEPDTKRIGVIVFEDPLNIKVSTVNDTDIVFSDGNNTVNVKNWHDTDHRISVLRFNLEEKTVEVTGLEKLDLSQSSEIQSLINKATLQNIANQQLENLDTDVVNGMKYLLSVRGIENGIDTHRVLGFDSVRDQEQFMLAYYSQYNEESLIQHNQVVEALVWMVAKGYSNEDKLILNEVFSVITSKRAIHRIVEKLEVVETIVPKVESFIRHHKEALSGRIASSLGNSTTIDIEGNYQRKRRAINEVPIANSGSRPTSWIASVAQWVKGFIGRPTAPGTPGTENSANGLAINAAVVHNTLLLGDVAARLITGNKYKQPKHDSLLSPKELIERRMDNTAINAINNFEKICDDKYGNDFQNATNNDEPMTCLSNISMERHAIKDSGSVKGIL